MISVEPAASVKRTLDVDLTAAVERLVGAQAPRVKPFRRRGWLIRRALALADIVALLLAFLVAGAFFGGGELARVGPNAELGFFFLTLPAWLVIAKIYGLYELDEERADHSTVDETVTVFHLVTVGVWLLLAVTWTTGLAKLDLIRLVAFWALAIAGIALARTCARAYCRRHVTYIQNTIIVGAGDVGQLVARKFLQHREFGINLVGFVDATPRTLRPGLHHLAVLGAPEDLPELVVFLDVERVVVAFSNESHEDTLELIRSLKPFDVQVDIVPRLFEIVGPNVGMHTVEGLPLLGLPPVRLSRSSALLKRTMDVGLACLALLVLAPVFALIALGIKLGSPGPVIFRQVRMGAGDRPFRIFKFRTMVADAEARKQGIAHLNIHARPGGDPRMFKAVDDPRVTRFGRVLRRYSLDELPQFVNVLRGEMSLVGPRPLVLAEDRFVQEWGRERLSLKPGITGPWQVLGASGIPFEEMVKLDYLYVTTWSLWNDVRLILRTVPLVLRERSAW
jgi:exopolysaccharide biosynthesis polyprenyl glycosylphosphotransferase